MYHFSSEAIKCLWKATTCFDLANFKFWYTPQLVCLLLCSDTYHETLKVLWNYSF